MTRKGEATPGSSVEPDGSGETYFNLAQDGVERAQMIARYKDALKALRREDATNPPNIEHLGIPGLD